MMDSEKEYSNGYQAAVRAIALDCMRKMDSDNMSTQEALERKVIQLSSERGMAISTLRRVCERYGDNEWEDNLHLADIIEKHLERILDSEEAE